MTAAGVEALDRRFGRDSGVRFEAGPGGLPVARVENAHARALVCLLGAQPLEFEPRGAGPVLWMSARSRFEPGRPIRGGIPVCWPWFGPHPDDPSKPAHGFARTRFWEVLAAGPRPGGATRIRLGLEDDEETRALWPHPFRLELEVTVGPLLEVALEVRNPGPEPFRYSGALHSYFRVGEAARVRVLGLEGRYYTDKTAEGARRRQDGPIRFEAETDRVFDDTTGIVYLDDPVLGRRIRISGGGSRSTVVWNPWRAKAAALPDFGDEEYREMACIETANAGADARTVPPGEAHRLTAEIGVES